MDTLPKSLDHIASGADVGANADTQPVKSRT
jgi:hypothetical protein